MSIKKNNYKCEIVLKRTIPSKANLGKYKGQIKSNQKWPIKLWALEG